MFLWHVKYSLKVHIVILSNTISKTTLPKPCIPRFLEMTFCNELQALFDQHKDEQSSVYHFSCTSVTSLLITHIMVNLQLIITPSFLINFSLGGWSCHFTSMLLSLSIICDHYAKERTAGRHTCHLQSCTKALKGACQVNALHKSLL